MSEYTTLDEARAEITRLNDLDDEETLSHDEERARKQLIAVCVNIAEQYGDQS